MNMGGLFSLSIGLGASDINSDHDGGEKEGPEICLVQGLDIMVVVSVHVHKKKRHETARAELERERTTIQI